MPIPTTFVSSSNLDAIGRKLNTLFVRFKNGAVYRYEKVPFQLLQQLLEADSIGSFFNKNIRLAFQYEKLDADPFDKPMNLK